MTGEIGNLAEGRKVPVLIGDVQISPCDLILMDLTGVIRIPVEIDISEQKMTEMILQERSLSKAKVAV